MFSELKTLIAIKQYGSFSAAGQHIGLTQAAVSAQMKSLEQQLGIALFERIGRKAALNVEGLRVIKHAEEIMQLVEKIKQPESLIEYKGTIKIGAISSIQSGFFPQLLKKFKDYLPYAKVRILPGVSFNLLNMVENGEINLAVIIRPCFPLSKEFSYYPLCKEAFVLVTPKEVTATDYKDILKKYPFIRYDCSSFGGNIINNFLSKHQIEAQEFLELEDVEAIVKMVENGLGVALIPHNTPWREQQKNLNVIHLGEETFYRELIVIMKKSNEQSIVSSMIYRIIRELEDEEKAAAQLSGTDFHPWSSPLKHRRVASSTNAKKSQSS